MEKIETNIKYKTFKLMQMDRDKKLVEIKVPDGVIFHLSMGRVTSAHEDRDAYNFIAVIPYDENIYKFLLEQKCCCIYTIYNIFDTYIAWIIKDSIPENFNTFPFTTEDQNIKPFYIKTLSVNRTKKNKMYADLLEEIYNRDGKYPPREEIPEIGRRCMEESSIVTGYMKIIDITFTGVRALHIQVVPDSILDSGIARQYITYNSLFSYEILLATENEFNNAVSETLQDFNII